MFKLFRNFYYNFTAQYGEEYKTKLISVVASLSLLLTTLPPPPNCKGKAKCKVGSERLHSYSVHIYQVYDLHKFFAFLIEDEDVLA
jgi:hypothetical protein